MDSKAYSRYGSHYSGGKHSQGGRRWSVPRRALIIGGSVAAASIATIGVATPALAAGTIDSIKGRAGRIAELYQELASCLEALDFVRIQEIAHEASTEIADFRGELDTPLWNIAEIVPVYGSDLKTAKTLLAMLGDLNDQVLVPVADTLAPITIETLFTSGDGYFWVNVAVIQDIQQTLIAALPLIRSSMTTLEGIGELHIDQLKNVVTQAKELLLPLADKIDTFEDVLTVLPQLLAADGQERLYLIAAQNNVELRSTGGFPGAWCPVYVNNGSITLGEVASLYDFIPVDDSLSVWMSDEELTLFGGSATYMAGNANCNPDFPRVCQMWSEFWTIFQGTSVSGIVAMDPIFLQSIVALTPGAQLEDGSWIDGTNTARVLMHDTYWNFMGEYQAMDDHFAHAAGVAADLAASSLATMDPKQLFDTVSAGIDNGNLLLWLANPDEQAVVEQFSNCSGAIRTDETKPELGIYLSNASWSKIDWWLNMDVKLGAATANADGSKTYPVTLDLSNAATWDEINQADLYIVGGNEAKWGVDDILNSLYLYAPAGGSIVDFQPNENYEWREATYNGLQVIFGYVHVLIDDPAHITFNVTVSPNATEDLSIRKTPTCQNIR